jgi:hypothetical protein
MTAGQLYLRGLKKGKNEKGKEETAPACKHTLCQTSQPKCRRERSRHWQESGGSKGEKESFGLGLRSKEYWYRTEKSRKSIRGSLRGLQVATRLASLSVANRWIERRRSLWSVALPWTDVPARELTIHVFMYSILSLSLLISLLLFMLYYYHYHHRPTRIRRLSLVLVLLLVHLETRSNLIAFSNTISLQLDQSLQTKITTIH